MPLSVQELLEELEEMRGHLARLSICRANSHVFVWASSGTGGECPSDLPCDCGSYRFGEIHKIQDVEIPTDFKVNAVVRGEWLDQQGDG